MEVATSSTGNYLYYNNSSVFGHINTGNSASSWSINSSSVRGTGDLITISITPTGNYIYVNNGSALGGYNSTGNPSFFPWMIEMSGLGTFRSISTLTN